MITSRSNFARGAVLLLVGCLSAGCTPLGMGFLTPIPIAPWVPERMEERLNTNDHKTPVLPPIPPGYRPLCEDPPDRAAILRAMPRVTRGIPYFYEEHRDDIEFTIEKLVDIVDPPRFYPLVGPAQLHHCHYKCAVYFNETIISSYPFPFQSKRRRVEVVYMDKDHLHVVVISPEARQAIAQDMSLRP